MQDTNTKQKRLQIIIPSIFIALLIIGGIIKSQLIKNSSVYVLGRFMYSTDEGSETGWLHHFNYTFGNTKFSTSFGAPIGEHFIVDSFMYIKISEKHPSLCEPITNMWVPSCVKRMEQPLYGWKTIPTCSNSESN